MSDIFEDIENRLGNAPEDDCGNDRLCSEAAMEIAQLRLNNRLARRRLDEVIGRIFDLERAVCHAFDALDQGDMKRATGFLQNAMPGQLQKGVQK